MNHYSFESEKNKSKFSQGQEGNRQNIGQKALDPGEIFSISEEKKYRIDGKEILIGKVEYTTDEKGTPVKRVVDEVVCDEKGRVLLDNELGFYCRSWTGVMTRYDDHCVCAMCQEEENRHRYVCIGVDGFLTEMGNCLCSECYEKNEKRKKWAENTFGLSFLFTGGIY